MREQLYKVVRNQSRLVSFANLRKEGRKGGGGEGGRGEGGKEGRRGERGREGGEGGGKKHELSKTNISHLHIIANIETHTLPTSHHPS